MKKTCLSVRELANQLLFLGPIHGDLASGVFVQVRSTEESSRFLGELAPMLEDGGMLVAAIDAARLMVEDGLSYVAQLVRAQCSTDCAPLYRGSELTLADALATTLQHRSRTVALLVGGAQRLLAEPDERSMKAIKAARDRVNLEPTSAGRLLLVATWILPSNPSHYVENSLSAFYGATAVNLI